MPARNNIGLLRLLFASLVIVGHAPEQLDGSRSREPLTALFHTLSLGEVAVDGFFLLSGFLITTSYRNSRSAGDYLLRRILRIYPAFVLAYLACILVLAPLTGGSCRGQTGETAFNLIFLQPPGYCPGQLVGIRHLNILNGAMWSIAYEFRCYILTLLLGICGLLARRQWVLALGAATMVASLLTRYPAALHPITDSLARAEQWPVLRAFGFNFVLSVRLLAIYLAGTCFSLFWREIEPWLSGWTAAACAAVAVAALTDPAFAEAGLAIFGAAVLFWVTLKARLGPLQRINDGWDISYGVYLYGWPVATYVCWRTPDMSPWLLAPLTLAIAAVFGAGSWWGLERHAKQLRLRAPWARPTVAT
jgi:peptidoglycan/LPS O-acetylase OafA/YrhL